MNGALSGSPAPALWRTRAAKPGQIMAALDLGTNNCRLLIARQGAGGYQVIDAFSRIVRLGEGVSQSGRLSPEAMDRTVEALKICSAKMERRGVSLARAVATEACRRAENCGGFVDRVREEAGIALDIISSGEEADLAFKGCTPLLDRNVAQAIVFDIGGGSTELGWLRLKPGRPPHMVAWHSMPFGVVSLTEEFGAEAAEGDNPMAFYRRMVDKVAAELDPFRRAIGAGRLISEGAVQMLGTSGTVTTLAGIQLGLARYERSLVDGSFLRFGDVERISSDLARRDCRGRATLPCIGVERADLVLSGCAILSAICRIWPVGTLRVADRGVREGILMSLMTGTAPDNVYGTVDGDDAEMDETNNPALSRARDEPAPHSTADLIAAGDF
ncbi:Ppx/GppA phosphatase family protein [Dongia mobilis]|uniref:Ppx/GppA phosphatase family protein n=1 Tax=Dongia sp. TaxID=1977262 RepID=UPI0026F3284A